MEELERSAVPSRCPPVNGVHGTRAVRYRTTGYFSTGTVAYQTLNLRDESPKYDGSRDSSVKVAGQTGGTATVTSSSNGVGFRTKRIHITQKGRPFHSILLTCFPGVSTIICQREPLHFNMVRNVERMNSFFSRKMLLGKNKFVPVYKGYEGGQGRVSPKYFRVVTLLILVCFSLLLLTLVPGFRNGLPVNYQCPSSASLRITAEIFHAQMKKGYAQVSESVATDMNEFLKTFRETDFDEWGQTYDYFKTGMTPFKSNYFAPYLKNGDTIYESACGIGLNLYMTLEILMETNGLKNLIVYGNELYGTNAGKANAVFDHIGSANSRKGVICTADSGHLGFVPENSFDLVYSGYLYQMMDPLNLGLGQDVISLYEDLCTAAKDNLEAARIITEIAQKRQDAWYGKWVAEMARIAKPGVPVIVEQVSQPKCDDFDDWGGVPKNWWIETAQNNTYGWNVDPSSVVLEDDTIFSGRYHVFMLKNGNRTNSRPQT